MINKLNQHFTRNGIPGKVISDNGPNISSQQVSNFKRMWIFDHRASSQAHPQLNEWEETAVKSAKQLMRKAKHRWQDPWLAELDISNTPSKGIGESLCPRLMNCRTKKSHFSYLLVIRLTSRKWGKKRTDKHTTTTEQQNTYANCNQEIHCI